MEIFKTTQKGEVNYGEEKVYIYEYEKLFQ